MSVRGGLGRLGHMKLTRLSSYLNPVNLTVMVLIICVECQRLTSETIDSKNCYYVRNLVSHKCCRMFHPWL